MEQGKDTPRHQLKNHPRAFVHEHFQHSLLTAKSADNALSDWLICCQEGPDLAGPTLLLRASLAQSLAKPSRVLQAERFPNLACGITHAISSTGRSLATARANAR